MKIKQQLNLILGLTIITTIVVCIVIISTSISLNQQYERVRFAQDQHAILLKIENTVNRLTKEVSDFLLVGNKKELREYQEYKENLNKLLKTYKSIISHEIRFVESKSNQEEEEEEEEIEFYEELFTSISKTLAITDRIIHETINNNYQTALDLFKASLEDTGEIQIDDLIAQQSEDEEREIQEANQNLSKTINQLQIIIIATMIGLVIITAYSARAILINVYGPIRSVTQSIEKIGRGDFSTDVRTDSKNEISLIATSIDRMSTELKRVQSQLIQSSKLASVGQLAAGVAHELNQPLMVIRLNAQMLLRQQKNDTLNPDDIAETLDMIERNTNRMETIINHLRTFSRQTDRHHEVVDINNVIDESFTMINEQLKIHNISVVKNFSTDLKPTVGNGNELEQVFINLITNSRDAIIESEDTERRIEISTAYIEEPPANEIIVADSGAGIQQDDVDRIFEPFFTTKPEGKGTGLGLSISYGIIQDHNGIIELLETNGSGTRFRIQLPIEQAPLTDKENHAVG